MFLLQVQKLWKDSDMIEATNKQQKEHRRGNKHRKEEGKQNRHTQKQTTKLTRPCGLQKAPHLQDSIQKTANTEIPNCNFCLLSNPLVVF